MASISTVGLIGVPYNVGWKGPGVEQAAQAFREAGLVDELKKAGCQVVDCGDVAVDLPPRDKSDPTFLNPGQVAAVARALATRVQRAVANGYFPLIIGGEDSVLMGIIEGLRQGASSEIGLIYMDAHGDFNTPETTPSGLIGGMNVAICAGKGRDELVNMFGHSPLLREENIVLYATRDLDPLEEKALAESKVTLYRRERLRQLGVGAAVQEIVHGLGSRCPHVHVHMDLDVLDETEVSAACLPVADGLSTAELRQTFQGLLQSGTVCSLAVMVFDTTKDPDGMQARKVVGFIADAFRGCSPA